MLIRLGTGKMGRRCLLDFCISESEKALSKSCTEAISVTAGGAFLLRADWVYS